MRSELRVRRPERNEQLENRQSERPQNPEHSGPRDAWEAGGFRARSRNLSVLVTGMILSLTTARLASADETRVSLPREAAGGFRYVAPSGAVRWFSEENLRRILGPDPYADFRSSGLPLNAWIQARNKESVGLTIAEVGAFTLAGIALLVGGGLIVGGITSEDALGRGIGWGLGLPIAGAGLVFGGVGAYLVWVDRQDRGAVRQPEFARGGAAPQRRAPGLALSVRW